MGLVIKLAVLLFCVKFLLKTGRPGFTASLYAAAYLVIALVIGLIQQFTLGYGIAVGVSLLYDLATGFIFFWLLDQYQEDLILFYTIIVGGIVANFAAKILISSVFF